VFGSQPFDANVGLATQNQHDLRGMVLSVTEVVQQEFSDVQLVPPESAALFRTLLGQSFEHPSAFLDAMISVVQHLLFGVTLSGRGYDAGEFFVVAG
jgi:hypothetical protein